MQTLGKIFNLFELNLNFDLTQVKDSKSSALDPSCIILARIVPQRTALPTTERERPLESRFVGRIASGT